MGDLVIIKLGGSLITDKRTPETPRPAVMARLAQELARGLDALAKAEPATQVVLGHGSGSFGHVAARKHGVAAGFQGPQQRPGISRTQADAARLHALVVEALLAAGLAPFSIAPSSVMMMAAGEPLSFDLETICDALELGFLPVVYGDVVFDRQQGIGIASTEKVLSALARGFSERSQQVRRMLWLGETDGIYDVDGDTIPFIDSENFRAVREHLGDPEGVDVTGGMRLRLDTVRALAEQGIPSSIIDGTQEGALEKALSGSRVGGTEVVAVN